MINKLPPSPDQLFGDLFDDVQLSGIFADSKLFVDCVPKLLTNDLLTLYETQKQKPGFDLNAFVRKHFTLPDTPMSDYVSDASISTAEHIDRLWDRLTRPADVPVANDSRVPLPHPYVVPGGRFQEIFYWDSYLPCWAYRNPANPPGWPVRRGPGPALAYRPVRVLRIGTGRAGSI